MISNYWHEKLDIPVSAKEYLKSLVKGRVVTELNLNGAIKKLYKVDANCFYKAFIENRKYLYNGEFTAPPDENDYLSSDNYLLEDGLAGFSISNSGWLVSMFSNTEHSGFIKASKGIITSKAYKLVCIVAGDKTTNGLVEVYKKECNFKEYSYTVDDTEIMCEYYGQEFIDYFISRNGKPHHVFMIGENSIGDKNPQVGFKGYFDAEEYVDKSVKNR